MTKFVEGERMVQTKIPFDNFLHIFYIILSYQNIKSCNLCLSVCLSDHNSGTAEPIYLKFR